MKLSAILRISKWEVLSGTSGLDKRTVVLILLAVGITGAVAAGTGGQTLQVGTGLYEVGVGEDVPIEYEIAFQNADSIQVYSISSEDPNLEKYDAAIYKGSNGLVVHKSNSNKGDATIAAMNNAISDYNNRIMRAESDQAAAFPVGVIVSKIPQSGIESSDSTGGGTGSGEAEQPVQTPPESPDTNGESSSGQKPGDVAPPFPFKSLILAFAFLIPMNFIVQAYGSSMIDERLQNRGELLLVSPITPTDIIAGKTIPYLVGITLVTAGISAVIGGGIISVLAILPLAFAFLAAVFVATIFARSYKELTFLTLGISVFTTSFAFIPAIFTEVHPISVISPLTIVVMKLRAEPITLLDFAFSTGPLAVTGILLFVLGKGVYREEDLFTQRPVRNKFLDALSEQITSVWSSAKIGAFSLPFVFVAELFVVAALFVTPTLISLPVILALAALIEEFGKSLHIFAGFENGKYERKYKTALIAGFLSGAGFFVAEKVIAVVQYVGLTGLQAGEVAFSSAILPSASAAGGAGNAGLVILLIWPFLHSITAMISAIGASKGYKQYFAAVLLATFVHIGYNLSVLVAYGVIPR